MDIDARLEHHLVVCTDLQKVKNFPQPVFLGLKFPQKGHKLKMQHFAKNL